MDNASIHHIYRWHIPGVVGHTEGPTALATGVEGDSLEAITTD